MAEEEEGWPQLQRYNQPEGQLRKEKPAGKKGTLAHHRNP